jgi:hypothetical protein
MMVGTGTMLARLIAVILVVVTIGCAGGPPREAAPPAPVQRVVSPPVSIDRTTAALFDRSAEFDLGIDAEADALYPNLKNRRFTLITDASAIDARGVHVIERLATPVQFTLGAIVLMDDGVTTPTRALTRALAVAAAHQSPPRVYTLDGTNWRLTPEMLRFSDTIVFDAALRGPRSSLEAAVLGNAIEQAGLRRLAVVILDRPPVAPADFVDGPPADMAAVGSRLAFLPIPHYPGLTTAEMARLFNSVFGLQARLLLVEMRNWRRGDGNAWLEDRETMRLNDRARFDRAEVRRSPFMTPGTAELQMVADLAGDRLWRHKALVFGRGGRLNLLLAPRAVDPATLMERLSALGIHGIEVVPDAVTVDGVKIGVARLAANPAAPPNALDLALALHYAAVADPRSYPAENDLGLFSSPLIAQGLARGLRPDQVRRRWITDPSLQSYQELRRKVLLYRP